MGQLPMARESGLQRLDVGKEHWVSGSSLGMRGPWPGLPGPQAQHGGQVWGTVPSVGNVAQPTLGKASGERGWQVGPMSMDRFYSGKSGLHCT